ncbi:hypothetical protein GLOIN_2v1804784 [Rhizophagus irregularis DAOM 181602=DAOM 197198]|nr:hypothetical protein GLOIN_2v1804784 [Rhizophagus irregularis DAOM 181602=DAOM 197198]CAB4474088.1 unnamed protein product [Rhizophagus irregularis]CAG8683089.1 18170_t:CDS:2 [Rhizophagus irregularis]
MSQNNNIIYFLVILVFTINYGNAIDVKVGDGYYPFDPSIVGAYYDEPIVFIRIGIKTFVLDEYDHCTKSERPDSFHAILTDEQPNATFIPKDTGRTEFKIHTNEPGCGFQDMCFISATNGASDNVQIPTIICNRSVIVLAVIGVVMAHFIL